MNIDFQHLALTVFVALGGIALVLKLADKAVPEFVAKAIHLILAQFPAARDFVIAHHQELDKIVDDTASAAKAELDAAAPAPAPEQPKQ